MKVRFMKKKDFEFVKSVISFLVLKYDLVLVFASLYCQAIYIEIIFIPSIAVLIWCT